MDASNTPKKKPLPGVLASEILRHAAAEHDVPTFPKVDGAYKDPPTLAAWRARLDNIGAQATFSSQVADEYNLLCEALLARVQKLEAALMPFATQGMMMANMQLCLIGAGRPDEPAGGTWLNGLQTAQMRPEPIIFYMAADVVGRTATEERVMRIFDAIRKQSALIEERDAHVADNTLQGPVGGPVGGRIH